MQFPPRPLLFFVFLNTPFLLSLSQSNPAPSQYTDCAPQPYKCGNSTFNISYPFQIDARPSYCGSPEYYINCTNNNTTLTITISDHQYEITSIDYNNNLINIVNKDFISDGCPQSFTNTTINTELFRYSQRDRNLTVYINCSSPQSMIQATIVNYACFGNSSYRLDNGSSDDLFGKCSSIINVPLGQETANNLVQGRLQLREALQQGFSLQWTASSDWCGTCVNSGGNCGFNAPNATQHRCFCPNGDSIDYCGSRGDGTHTTRKIVIGVACGFGSFFLACAIIFYFYGRKLKKHTIQVFHKKYKAKKAYTIEAFLANFDSQATKRYTYSDIKRMTKSFSDKIGQGGFGSVYKGKLFNGHLVAVKILSETKGSGEDFINEVAAIGKTSHVNIVSLLGFCVEGSKRALIYDFMSNGSLDKYINLDKDINELALGWEKLYEITIGIARGLEYLHRGCNTRIVHFDIKPHNILLDQDFCPKISDFGMAKLCLPKQSIISIYGARGTIGYIAPEVFSRSFGVVSSKSDVYSYGMMLLELFGSKRKNTAILDSASENYFPQSIYQNIENKDHLDANEYGLTEEYEETAKKIMIVGFWCIQTMPENRPTISKVVEMLEGSIHDLSIPPKPILSSPQELIASFNTTSSS